MRLSQPASPKQHGSSRSAATLLLEREKVAALTRNFAMILASDNAHRERVQQLAAEAKHSRALIHELAAALAATDGGDVAVQRATAAAALATRTSPPPDRGCLEPVEVGLTRGRIYPASLPVESSSSAFDSEAEDVEWRSVGSQDASTQVEELEEPSSHHEHEQLWGLDQVLRELQRSHATLDEALGHAQEHFASLTSERRDCQG